jgi:hypothetical protein
VQYTAIIFDAIDHPNGTYNYTFQFGTDTRLAQAKTYPSAGIRQLIQQAQFSNAFLKEQVKNITDKSSTFQITSGIRVSVNL